MEGKRQKDRDKEEEIEERDRTRKTEGRDREGEIRWEIHFLHTLYCSLNTVQNNFNYRVSLVMDTNV